MLRGLKDTERQRLRCSHCEEYVPRERVERDASLHFCCRGCETIYHAILNGGFGEYYALRARLGSPPTRTVSTPQIAGATGRSYDEFDDDAFARAYTHELADGRRAVRLHAHGLHCAACVWLLERVPQRIPGLARVNVDFGRARLDIEWEPARVRLSEIARAIDSLGYALHPFRGEVAAAAARREDRDLLVRTALSGAIAGNVMAIAFALYGGLAGDMTREYEQLFRWTSLLLSTPAVWFGGSVFVRGAARALRAGFLHMDLPISIGILGGYFGGVWNTVRGNGEIYFDSITVLIFLLLGGRMLQRRQQRRAADSGELLRALYPRRARRIESDAEAREILREVPLEALGVGERVEVGPGEVIPVDGVVESGRSTLDVALLTGEAAPQSAAPGTTVHAGTVNLTGTLRLLVEQCGAATRVGRLIERVELETRARARIVQFADQVAGWFVAGVLIVTVCCGAYWTATTPALAFERILALLVVTCPCALGLAIPLALSVALGRAARHGIWIKGGDVLETLARPGIVWLDKTGTITQGRLAVVGFHGDDAARPLVASLERAARHPLGRALATLDADAAPPNPRTAIVATDVEELPGAGIRGLVAGRAVCAGTLDFVRSHCGGADLPQSLEQFVATAAELGHTPVVFGIDGHCVAAAAVADPLRPEAMRIVRDLAARGWQVGLLSGDHPKAVERVGRELGLAADHVIGGASPEDKLERLRTAVAAERATAGRRRAARAVVMVGDGINDAAALAVASPGIAVRGGAEAALAAADVYLIDGIAALPELCDAARSTFQTLWRGLWFSLAYNLAGVAFAVSGHLSPLVAAILMPLSSLTVLGNAMAQRSFAHRPASLAALGVPVDAISFAPPLEGGVACP
ncbi:MAG: heavy metal translocating P-type ATPase [Planctomycetota bacterium]